MRRLHVTGTIGVLKGLPTVSTDMEELRKQFGKGEADTLQKRISKVELQMDELDGQLRQPGASPADVAYRRERQKRLEDEMILLRQQQLVMIKAVTEGGSASKKLRLEAPEPFQSFVQSAGENYREWEEK